MVKRDVKLVLQYTLKQKQLIIQSADNVYDYICEKSLNVSFVMY